jgi:hypothetical protein
MIDAYTYFGWPELCEAIACIRVAVRRGAVVVPMRRVIASGDVASDVAGFQN